MMLDPKKKKMLDLDVWLDLGRAILGREERILHKENHVLSQRHVISGCHSFYDVSIY